MKTVLQIPILLAFVVLFAGFRWSMMFGDLNWEAINSTIEEDYPGVPEITADDVYGLLGEESAVHLVDVRESVEYSVSHLPGAVQVADFVPDRLASDSLIVAYCSVGLRSAKYVQQLKARGFTRVYNLRGSIFTWANRGLPLVVDGRKALHVHPYSERWGKLLKENLHSYQPLE